jgi:hypothetical protein
MPKLPLWRAAFFFSGAAMMAGGPRHPSPHLDLPFNQSIALMLADPEWTPSHLLMLASYLLLLLGLVLWRSGAGLSGGARRWVRFAVFVAVLACVEMAFHAAAVLDLERLRAAQATPILTIHLWLTAVGNPLLGLALAGVAIHGARLGRLGSWWIAWMAVLGGAAFGFAGTYVVLTHDQRVSPLFAVGASLMAFWMLFAAVWPVRAPAPVHSQALQPLGA